MGNSQLDTTLFPNSTKKWLPTQTPSILICPQLFIQSQYQLFDSISYQDLKYYVFRTLHKDYLINVHAILKKQKLQQSLKTITKQKDNIKYKGKEKEKEKARDKIGQYNYAVLIQKIQYRLIDLGVISFQDAIYILRQGINSIKILLKIYDKFVIEEQAIGFNSKGECKIWVNSNYFRNDVENYIIKEEDEKNYKNNDNNNKLKYTNNIYITNNANEICCMDIHKPKHQASDNMNRQQINTMAIQQNTNVETILYSFLNLIENRMMYLISGQEQRKYQQIKAKYLGNICKYQQNINKINKNLYIIQKIEQFIAQLCSYANIGTNYKIQMPTQTITSFPITSTIEPTSKTNNLLNKSKSKQVNSKSQILQLYNKPQYMTNQLSPSKLTDNNLNYKIRIHSNKLSLKKQNKAKLKNNNNKSNKNEYHTKYNDQGKQYAKLTSQQKVSQNGSRIQSINYGFAYKNNQQITHSKYKKKCNGQFYPYFKHKTVSDNTTKNTQTITYVDIQANYKQQNNDKNYPHSYISTSLNNINPQQQQYNGLAKSAHDSHSYHVIDNITNKNANGIHINGNYSNKMIYTAIKPQYKPKTLNSNTSYYNISNNNYMSNITYTSNTITNNNFNSLSNSNHYNTYHLSNNKMFEEQINNRIGVKQIRQKSYFRPAFIL